MSDYRPDGQFPVLIPPYTVLLKDGETTATIYPIHNSDQLPPGLLAFLVDEFNMEVERGDTFPFFDILDIEEFKNYWFGSFAAVMVLGDEESLDRERQWEKECLGSFFIKAQFPGRSSHVCTGAFLVNAGIRGKGIGKTLAECFLDWSPKLGYTSTVFTLVFETNVPARYIFESLNFKRCGRIKAAGILKDHETAVDSIIYGKELIHPHDVSQVSYRFDKIKYYLETGRYPPLIDRQAKSRLRSSASHYRIVDGKLMLKGREVISDPVKQLEICTEYHLMNHGGINKTTTAIAERYHWTRIKDTVAQAIRNCNDCRDPTKTLAKKKKELNVSSTPASSSNRAINSDSNNNNNQPIHHSMTLHNGNHQDIDAALAAASQLQRTDPTLLQADLTNLDDPSGILAAVEAAQRSNTSQNNHHHHHQQEQHNHDLHQSQHIDKQQKHTQHAFQGKQGKQQSLYQQQYPGSYQQVSANHHHHHYLSDNHQQRNENSTNNRSIPVDPEVSAFDNEHVQAGTEIEIARALIQHNAESDDSAEGEDRDTKLF